MILLDTNVLVYALGKPHPLREPSRRLMEAVSDGSADGHPAHRSLSPQPLVLIGVDQDLQAMAKHAHTLACSRSA